ncbi:MAG TPA: riboflavin synthase [Solirubrobacteraceae bacterium]|nr:riboflavin synthase [Solirubrobacteraceae bacterium]
MRRGSGRVFTGLIGDLGTVSAFALQDEGASVRVRSALADELEVGDSIAVEGVCLTATALGPGEFAAQVMAETLARTSLSELGAGARVNLELPLRAGDRLGGHFVQGHVDGTGAVTEVREEGFSRVLTLELDPRLARYLVEKGSVALSGVSLTVSALEEPRFCVSLIPETLRRTTLGELREGAIVNVEVDVLAKHLERLAQPLGEAVRQ